jgi:hypothetical protein
VGCAPEIWRAVYGSAAETWFFGPIALLLRSLRIPSSFAPVRIVADR